MTIKSVSCIIEWLWSLSYFNNSGKFSANVSLIGFPEGEDKENGRALFKDIRSSFSIFS